MHPFPYSYQELYLIRGDKITGILQLHQMFCNVRWFTSHVASSGRATSCLPIEKYRAAMYGAEHYSRGHQLCSRSRICKHSMEPEGSLPHSQELFTYSYPEPDYSSQYPHTPSLQIHLSINHPPTSWSSQWFLPYGFLTNKSLPLLPILSQTNPFHTTPSYLSKIHLNIIHPHLRILNSDYEICIGNFCRWLCYDTLHFFNLNNLY
jgi:hypothetical protein